MLDLAKYDIADKWPKLAKLQAEVRDLERAREKAQSEDHRRYGVPPLGLIARLKRVASDVFAYSRRRSSA
jgi:hypothetical protein